MSKSRIAASYMVSLCLSFWGTSKLFHSSCTVLYPHQQYTRVSTSPHPCQHSLFALFDCSHPSVREAASHCGFDLNGCSTFTGKNKKQKTTHSLALVMWLPNWQTNPSQKEDRSFKDIISWKGVDAKRAALAKSQVSSGLGQIVTFLKPVIIASSLKGSIPVNSSWKTTKNLAQTFQWAYEWPIFFSERDTY